MLATESDRLQYLSALGITQYRARAPLPFAAPSLALQQTDLVTLIASASPSAVPPQLEAEPRDTAAALAPPAIAAATSSSTMQSGASAALNAISALAPEPAPAPAPAATIASEPALAVTASAAPDANSQPFHCQLALWQQDDAFILTDVTQLQAADVQLLKNILAACGRRSPLAAPQQFSWPLAKRRNSAFFDAREHFLGLLDASLANQPIKQLFNFGAQSLRLLSADHETADQLSDANCQDDALRASLQAINFAHRWPLTALPSLTQMLQQPARYKPLAWQLLQSRISL